MNYKALLIISLLSLLSIKSLGQNAVSFLNEKQSRGVIGLYTEYKFQERQISLLKEDTASYKSIIGLQVQKINALSDLNKDLTTEINKSYDSSKKHELDLEKQKSRHKKITSTLLVVSGTLLAVLLLK